MTLPAALNAPFSQEAEEAVLGAIMVNSTALYTVSGFLKATDFFLLRHNRIYAAMTCLSERGDPLDYVTIAQELKNGGVFDEVGGHAYLMQLENNTPTSVHAEIYGQLVQRSSIRRKMLEASDKIRELAMDESKNVEAVVNESAQAVADAGQMREERITPMYNLVERYYDRLENTLKNGIVPGIPTGFRDLDQLLGGLQKSDLIIVAARPGMGKTSLAHSMAVTMGVLGRRVLITSQEMDGEQVAMRMLSQMSGVNMQKVRLGQITPQEQHRLMDAMGRLGDYPITVDDRPAVTTADIKNTAKKLYMEQGLDAIFVDYLQLLTPTKSRASNRQEEVAAMSKDLKELARDLRIPVVALAQLNRDVENRSDKRPGLADLRESGAIENNADVVMFIYRDEVYNEATEFPNQADIIVAKHRNGPTGIISLYFDKTITKFMDANVHRVDLSSLV